MNNGNLIRLDNTKFIFKTNFSMDPGRERYACKYPHANIIINDPGIVDYLLGLEFPVRVKQTEPRPGEEEGFVPTYFVDVKANFDSEWPPKIYLVSGDADPVPLDAESVGSIDNCYVLNVNTMLNIYHGKDQDSSTLWIRTMYVEQDVDDDPYAAYYANRRRDDD